MDAIETLLADRATYTAFGDGQKRLATGRDPVAVIREARAALAAGAATEAVIFDDASGKRTELGPWEADEAVAERLRTLAGEVPRRQGPGRPRLGVVSREVSLLPRHWAWLGQQPGGASAALRRLVEEAQKAHRARDLAREAREAVHAFLWPTVGDAPGFEAASRALWADRFEEVEAIAASHGWPEDVRAHAARLLEVARGFRDRAAAEAAA